ncbi:MAG: hypothetical protein FWF69_04185 [Firmicutes bacterium]|nr:hypothetical protein [Bacillota bacterium]
MEQVSNVIRCPINPALRSTLEDKRANLAQRRAKAAGGPRGFAAIGNYHLVKGVSNFLEQEVGLPPIFKVCTHASKTVLSADTSIQFAPDERVRVGLLKALHNAVLLADDVSLQLTDNGNIKIKASHPSIDTETDIDAEAPPLCGEAGSDSLLRMLCPVIG